MTRALAQETHMKGGIKHNGEESQGREEEGWQETLTASPVEKKGATVAPFSICRGELLTDD